MPTTPVAPSAVPDFPSLSDRVTYNARAYAWAQHMDVTFGTEMFALATVTKTNADEAQADAVATAADRVQTGMDRVQTGLDAVATASDRVQTGVDATASAASAVQASKLNLGNKAAAPTLDNQGAALLAGATYYDTVLSKWRVWTGVAWGDGISSISGVSSVNGLTGDLTLPPTQVVAYDSRAGLRSQSPAAGAMAVVEGLGFFVWESASTEPDDDESAFATASGVWLLQAASWDLVDAWQSPDQQALTDDDEDSAGKILHGSATCSITSVASVSSTSFTGTVSGASLGDRVIATPPNQLGSTAAFTGDLSYHTWISAVNTVTIMLTNASAQSATTNTAIRAAWPITVIKS